MTDKQAIASLLKQTEEDYQTAKDLFKDKHFHYALFFGQLVLERLLKALVIHKTKEIYPPIHNLKKLAVISKLPLNNEEESDFDEITSFNISARYDDLKLSFYKKATTDFTKMWFAKITKYKIWLEKQF